MKKILLAIILLGFTSVAFAQSWVQMMHDPSVNFYETQQEFNNYWKGRPMEKGKGYKAFRRWEEFMEPRVYPKGDITQASRAYEEFQKYLNANGGNVISINAQAWVPMGPTGPSIGGGAGRVNFIRFHPTTPTTIYAGAPAGGLWVSTNNGTSWTTNTDQLSVIGTTDLAIDPSNPQIMYLATGDGDAGDTYSIGVLKSTDGGATWNPSGLSWTVTQGRTISRLLINPTNPQILIAATSNGIYRTSDAGNTWTQVQTGNFKDAEYKPGDPNTVYACGTTFWLSTNGGTSFSQVTTGLPTTGVDRMAIAVTPANSAYVYMIVANSTNSGLQGVYRSTNSGTSFSVRSTTPNYLGWNSTGSDSGGQGWYDLAIAASPTNQDVIIIGGINIWRSTNGGTTFSINGHWTGTGAPYVHADIHDLVFLPGSGTTYLSGNDGGVFRTTNSGTAWTDISANMQIAQQYRVGLSTTNATLLVTGHQDNGTNKLNGTTWTEIYGGDGMDCFIDRTNNNNIFASYVYGDFQRSTNGGTNWTNIVTGLTGNSAWLTPWHQDPVTATTLYCGYTNIFRSTNSGTSWTQVGSLTGTGTVVELDIAPSNNQILYAAKSNALFKSTNGGTSWTNVTGTLPVASAAITYIEISPTDPNRVYVTFSGYSSGNKVYLSTNGGTSWTNYSTGLPNLPVNCIVYQNSTSDAVYIGTDVGVYYRDNTLTTWQAYFTGLPNVIVRDLEIYYATGKLRAATFGRGTWETDLYTPGTLPPAADFTSNRQMICAGQSVNFTDLTSYSPSGWSWTFTGGTPSASTAQNPTVTYNTPGTYAVTLTASNTNGSDTETKTAYITVSTAQTLPLTEGFESATFAPANWYVMDDNANALTWKRNGTFGAYGTSSACAIFDNYNDNDIGARDELWTPKYNFTGLTSATLTFDVAYARYNATYSDTLAVLVSTDCGQTFTQVYLKGGNTLSTNGSADVTTQQFVPTNSQWRNETVSLTPYVGQANVMVVFQNRARYGQSLYLDNINITGVATPSLPVAEFSGTPQTICAGQTVTFTNLSTNSPTSYAWTFTGGTPGTSTTVNPTVTYNTPGTYAVTLVATNANGSDTETKTNYITVNALPTATAGSNSPVCTGTTINLTTPTVTGATYAWTGPGGFTSSLQNPTRTNATTAMAGTYTVTVTANGCTSTSSTTVVVNASPTATATNTSPVCAGASFSLSTPSVTGATYAWTGPLSYTSALRNPTITNSTTGMSGVYTVTVTANGCSATSSTTVTVNALPTATAASNSPVCAGSALNLTTPTVTGATYAWTGPGGYTSAVQNPTRTNATTAMSGTYTVTVTANGCSATSSVVVTVNALPAASASNTGPVCAGNSFSLNTTAVTGATYSWSGPGGYSSALQNPAITNATTTMSGVYTVTVTANGCSSTSTTTVTVSAGPTATAGSNSPICAGNTINLTTPTVAGATYAWSGPSGYTSSVQNPSITNATTSMSGVYTVTVSLAGCSTSSSTSVTVNALPTANAGSNSPVCAGSTINLTTTTVTGATYAWSGPGGYTSSVQNPNRTNATTAMSGTYTVTVTANGCSSTSSTTVTVNPLPTASATNTSPICAGNSFSLNTTTVAGATYSWSGPGGYSSATQNPTITNATTAMGGVYTVTVSLNGCSSTSTTTATVTAGPTANATNTSPVCAGGTFSLSTPNVGGATYAWSGPGGYTSAVRNPSVTNATTAMSGVYTVTVTVSGCSTTSSTTVTVNALPTATAASNSPVCAGSSINLTTPAVAGATYSWSGPGGYTSALQNPTRTNATTTMSGTYSVTVTANGCTSTSSTTVTVNSLPAATATNTSPVCAGASFSLSTPAVTGATYSWSGPGGYTSAIRNPTRTNATTAMSGVYTVTVTANGCSNTSTTTVVVNPLPTATAGSNSPVCAGSTINLTTPTVPGATYAWTGPGGYTSALQNPTRNNATTAMSGTYTVTVTAGGCSNTSTVTVTVNALPTATATNTGPVCSGNSFSLSTPSVTGATYAWTGPGGYTSAIRNPTITNATTAMSGVYTVTVTANGCASTSTTTVTVNPGPTALASNTSPVCEGVSFSLSTPTVTGATYAWTGPNGFTSSLRNPLMMNTVASMSGVYTVTVSLSGCSTTSSTTVTVTALPTASAGSNAPVCEGSTINLTTPAVSGATYAWSGPSFSSSSQNPVISNAASAMAGNYTVTVTANGCSNTSTTNVTVTSLPVANAASNSPVCEGQNLDLTASTVTGATYSWSGPAGFSSLLQNETIANTNTSMSGAYVLTVTANGCSGTSTVNVVVNALPTANASNNGPVCEGNSFSLSTPTVSGATYSWTGPLAYTASTENPVVTGSTSLMSGTYIVTVTENGCSNTSSTFVVIDPAVTANAGADEEICPGETVFLNATGGGNYSWSPVTDLSDPSIANPVSTPSATITYTVTVNNGACTDTDDITITLGTIPPIPVITQNGNTLECTPSSGFTYQWYVNGSPVAGATSSSYVPTTSGHYTVNISDPVGCESKSETFDYKLPLGYEDISENGAVQIFPNPNDGNFTILINLSNAAEYKISMHNSIGQIVWMSEFTSNGKTEIPVRVKDLQRGVYTLSISSQGSKLVERIVIN